MPLCSLNAAARIDVMSTIFFDRKMFGLFGVADVAVVLSFISDRGELSNM